MVSLPTLAVLFCLSFFASPGLAGPSVRHFRSLAACPETRNDRTFSIAEGKTEEVVVNWEEDSPLKYLAVGLDSEEGDADLKACIRKNGAATSDCEESETGSDSPNVSEDAIWLKIETLEGDAPPDGDDLNGVSVEIRCAKGEGSPSKCRVRYTEQPHDGSCEPRESIKGADGAKITSDATILTGS
ncbi:unnamed protein product [Vitrella brassicaformis CCMP3155]|uniref:Fibronectin type-III domain-containing protein n=1 Tax=Vitrella brassicaformis (strain CCMP3155) TaxID=1169540 RepID=A0A0G4EB02_VITBC|nr:unnamed protein product [Vitrella brassicaformis CCMP3155]|eukprot:CEL93104.1 unnamed protein product [Vitrella brassicaformis CCMP3155]